MNANARAAKARGYAAFALFSIFTGVLAGAAVWLVLRAINLGCRLLWEVLPQALGVAEGPLTAVYVVAACLVGGLLVGAAQKRWGAYPQSLNAVMGSVKRTGRYEHNHLGRIAACALLPLVFGGSVGPEAGLTGIVAGLCTWAGDRLRHAGPQFREAASVGTAAVISAIFSAPLFGLAAPLTGSCDGPDGEVRVTVPRATKVAVYLCAVAGALGAMFALGSLFGRQGGLPRISSLAIGGREFAMLVPCALLGAAAGWAYHGFDRSARALDKRLGERPVLKGLLAGLGLGICGALLPYTMFSGEEQTAQLAEAWTSMSALALVATGFVKVLVTPLCLRLGWRGGHFFPVIFAGIALGYGCALLSGADAGFCLCACTGALMGAVMRQPLMAVLLLFLCFPLKGAPVMLAAAALGSLVPLPKAWREPPEKTQGR